MKRTMSQEWQIIYCLSLRFTGVEEMSNECQVSKDDLVSTTSNSIETVSKHKVLSVFTISTPLELLITQCSFHEQERPCTRLRRQIAVEA